MTLGDGNRRRFDRYAVDAPVRAFANGKEIEGRLKDISATGAAVITDSGVEFENNMFVELHMEGIGHRKGYKARDIPKGFALQFDEIDEATRKQMEADIAAFRGSGIVG